MFSRFFVCRTQRMERGCVGVSSFKIADFKIAPLREKTLIGASLSETETCA